MWPLMTTVHAFMLSLFRLNVPGHQTPPASLGSFPNSTPVAIRPGTTHRSLNAKFPFNPLDTPH